MVGMLGRSLRGHMFNFQSFCCQVTTLGKLFIQTSVKGRWCTGKVTAGLVESISSITLGPGDWLWHHNMYGTPDYLNIFSLRYAVHISQNHTNNAVQSQHYSEFVGSSHAAIGDMTDNALCTPENDVGLWSNNNSRLKTSNNIHMKIIKNKIMKPQFIRCHNMSHNLELPVSLCPVLCTAVTPLPLAITLSVYTPLTKL